MARIAMLLGLLVLIIALAACGSSQANTTAGAGVVAQGTPGGFFGGGEMPLSMTLPAGTLMLEDTANAVTAAQAKELLPLWQMLRALQESGTSSQVEVEAVYDQIQEAMTPDQIAAIDEMDQEDMRALFEELGMGRPQGESDTESEERTGPGGPPEGGMMVMPPGGGEGGPGMGPGGFGDVDPEARATVMAGRGGMGMGFGTGMIDAVIELLETRAGES